METIWEVYWHGFLRRANLSVASRAFRVVFSPKSVVGVGVIVDLDVGLDFLNLMRDRLVVRLSRLVKSC